MPNYEKRPDNPLELFPPDTLRQAFLHADVVPFEYGVQSRSLANAYWFAEASLLAYARPQNPDHANKEFKQAFIKAGGTHVSIHAGNGFTSDTNWFVISAHQFQVLVFRGSEIVGSRWDAKQFMGAYKTWFVTDANVVQTPWHAGGNVHSGFNSAYTEVSADIREHINPDPDIPLFITGHSLGAALAMLAASDLLKMLNKSSTVYTFGAPRVGDMGFVMACQKIPVFRFINSIDLATRMPPRSHLRKGSYRHYPENGRQYNYSLDSAQDKNADQYIEDYCIELALQEIAASLDMILDLIHGRLSNVAISLFRSVVEHAPVLYAIAAYNDWVNLRLVQPPYPIPITTPATEAYTYPTSKIADDIAP